MDIIIDNATKEDLPALEEICLLTSDSGADGRRAGRGEFSEAHVTGSAAGGTARRAARDVLERRREILPVAFSEKGAIIRIRTFVRITAKGELF